MLIKPLIFVINNFCNNFKVIILNSLLLLKILIFCNFSDELKCCFSRLKSAVPAKVQATF